MEELKQIPDGGTRRKAALVVFWIGTFAWLSTIFMVLTDRMTQAQAELVGVDTEMWWVITGVTLFIYVGSETANKFSFATLNRK